MQKAVSSQHPFLKGAGVPDELQWPIDKHVHWSEAQLSKYRLAWCKKWLVRARDLDQFEMQCNESRPSHVAEVTKGKRILLTKEILEDLGYGDMAALSLLEAGATLAGEIEPTQVFPISVQTLFDYHGSASTGFRS